MHKLRASTYKEFLLLSRDWGGVAVLFIMPVLLLLVITSVQDSTFKSFGEFKMPVILVDNDHGEVSGIIAESLANSNSFEIISMDSEEAARDAVFSGKEQLAIVIPENLSLSLQNKVDKNVRGILEKFGLDSESKNSELATIPAVEVRLYFDPVSQMSFKSAIKNAIDRMVSKIETERIYNAFLEELGEQSDTPKSEIFFDTENLISFKEILPTKGDEEI